MKREIYAPVSTIHVHNFIPFLLCKDKMFKTIFFSLNNLYEDFSKTSFKNPQ